MAPTLAEVLALPVLRAGRPVVLTGQGLLDRPVRWVHVGEIPELASMLRGGELVLTTGVALPESARGLSTYVATLGAAGACALVIELGRRFPEVPDSIVAAGREHGLPVVALRRPVRFVAVTETLHSLIVNEQYELLQLSEKAHQEFTALSVEGASVQRIVDRLAAMAGHPVVLEDLSHRVVAYSCEPGEAGELLDGWENRSRLASGADTGGTVTSGPEGWLVTPVGPSHQRWGRLVVPTAAGEAPLTMLVERAAEALAINRLVERDRAGLVQQAHRGLLTDLQLGRGVDPRELTTRAQALGLPTSRHTFVGIAVQSDPSGELDPVTAEGRDRALAEAAIQAAGQAGLPCLASPVRTGQVVLLAALPAGRSLRRALERFADDLDGRLRRLDWPEPHVVGVGREVAALVDAARSLSEATHVAEVGLALRPTRPKPWYESGDVRLRGLLALLRADPRVLAFAEAELGALLRHDAARGSDLTGTLWQYFQAGGNKTVLAQRTHLSRPALYARLATIERVLGISLDDPESAVALHVALLVRDVSAVSGAAAAAR